MKKYESAELEIIFYQEDVITESGDTDTSWTEE